MEKVVQKVEKSMWGISCTLDSGVRFVKAGKFQTAESFQHKPQYNQEIELIFNLGAPLHFRMNDISYTISEKEWFLIPPQTPFFADQPTDSDCSFYWIHFQINGKTIPFEEQELPAEILRANSLEQDTPFAYLPLHFSAFEIERILILANQILDVGNSHFYTPRYRNTIVELLLMEMSHQVTEFYADHDEIQRLIHHVQKWIKMNVRKDIDFNQLAETLGYNRTYVSRIFKKATGKTLVQSMNEYKILDAKYQLLNTNNSVKEIAYALSFRDEHYFMKLFKASEGMSPTAFRNTYKNTNYNTTY